MIKKGKLIAFIGIDGSGKTSQSRRLLDFLSNKKRKAVMIRPFFTFSGKLVGPISLSGVSSKRRSLRGGLLRLAPAFLLIDNWLNYLVYIFPRFFGYDYIICDRYFYDYYPSLMELGWSDLKINSFYARFLPAPDRVFWLDVNPEIAMGRKNEQSVDLLKRNRERYLLLKNQLPFIYKLQADGKEEAVFEELLRSLKSEGLFA